MWIATVTKVPEWPFDPIRADWFPRATFYKLEAEKQAAAIRLYGGEATVEQVVYTAPLPRLGVRQTGGPIAVTGASTPASP